MKKLIIALIISMMIPVAFAQKITGRWHCPTEVVKQYRLGFDGVSCRYKFKKNGTFVLKIKGDSFVGHKHYTGEYEHHHSGTIVIKGKYSVKDGKITSYVEKDNIETAASVYPNYSFDGDGSTASQTYSEYRLQNGTSNGMEINMRRRIMDNSFLWDWKDVPIEQAGNQLKIGDKLILQ